MKLEMKKGLQLLIHKFSQRGLSVPCQSLHNTPIFQLLNQMGKAEWYKTSEQEMKLWALFTPLWPILMKHEPNS